MVRVKKIFSDAASETPYAIKVHNVTVWLSEEELIQLAHETSKFLPKKKVQIPFSEGSMPAGKMKVMIPM